MTLSDSDPVLATIETYESAAERWASETADRRNWNASYDLFQRHASPGWLTLDLGCGAGADATGLASRGFRLVGVDMSVSLLRLAQNEKALLGRVCWADMRALPIRAASFDAVWADGSLHHLPKAQLGLALSEIGRLLKPEGVLFASVERGASETMVLDQSLGKWRFYAKFEPDEVRAFLSAYSFDTMEQLLGEPGYRTDGWIAVVARKRP